MKTKTAIILMAAALVFASLAGGCTMGPVEIVEVVACKNVDSEYKPIDPATVFPSGTGVVYVSVKINNMTTEDKITTKWNYLETGDEINVTDFISDEPGSGYIGFSLSIEGGFPAGKYNSIVYLNDELIETVEFSVE